MKGFLIGSNASSICTGHANKLKGFLIGSNVSSICTGMQTHRKTILIGSNISSICTGRGKLFMHVDVLYGSNVFNYVFDHVCIMM